MIGDAQGGGVVELSELDGSACADALTSSQASLVDAERLQVELVAQWCDLHSGGRWSHDRVLPGRERAVVVGGDGTPAVGEFAAAELAVLLGMTTQGAQGLMRDVLGLRHRHPRVYALVCSGAARFFQARLVARATLSAGLTLAQARHVDDRVAPFLGQVPWGRILGLVDAAMVEADPEAAEQRRITAEMARFVRTGRSTEFGTMTIFAKARAGDAVFFMAMCDRIAQILRLRRSLEVAGHADRHPDDATGPDAAVEMDVLRSEAVGILANPVQAVALLHWAEHRSGGAAGVDRDAQREAQSDPSEWEPSEPDEHRCPPGVVLDASARPEAYRPWAVLYVHVSQESFERRCRGAARVEGVGPVTIEQAVDFLRSCHVTVRPVIDLNGNPSADGYEVSPLVRETVVLRDPVETFPWGTLASRKVDADHLRSYRPEPDPPRDRDGPGPGSRVPQTNADNLQPLGRLHHRLKTHGGWTCSSPERGVVLWRSPHGHWTRVDSSGTTYIGRLEGAPVVAQVVDAHLGLLMSG